MNGLESLVDDIISDKPEASEFISENGAGNGGISQESSGGSNQSDTGSPPFIVPDDIPTNDSPEQFDPNIHSVDATGNPRRNKDGSFTKKRGRKASQNQAQQTTQASQDLKVANAAAATVTIVVLIGILIDAEEWKPQENELLAMNMAWKDYYQARGVQDIPPWLGVVIAMTAYVAPRVQRPKTSNKLRQIFNSIKQTTIIGLKMMKVIK